MMFRGTANDGAVKLVNDFAHLAETLLGKVRRFAETRLGKVCHFRWSNILSSGEQDTVYAYTVIKSQVYS